MINLIESTAVLVFAAFGQGWLAMMCLWPINDQPTSSTQVWVCGLLSGAYWAIITGQLHRFLEVV